MTNGAVGQAVSSVDGPAVTVKYMDGEKKIIVGPILPIVRYEVGDDSELKPGAGSTLRPRPSSRIELFRPLVSTSAATARAVNEPGCCSRAASNSAAAGATLVVASAYAIQVRA